MLRCVRRAAVLGTGERVDAWCHAVVGGDSGALVESLDGRGVERSEDSAVTGLATHSATRDNAAGHHQPSSPVRLPGGQGVHVVSHTADYD